MLQVPSPHLSCDTRDGYFRNLAKTAERVLQPDLGQATITQDAVTEVLQAEFQLDAFQIPRSLFPLIEINRVSKIAYAEYERRVKGFGALDALQPKRTVKALVLQEIAKLVLSTLDDMQYFTHEELEKLLGWDLTERKQ